jgi:hypothetical protein
VTNSEWSALHRSIVCRHHPRKRVNQYAVTFWFITSALEYWVARSSRAMTAVGVADALNSHPVTKSHTSFAFSAMMMTAVSAASAVSQRGATNGPILARLAVNITSGTTANGSCRLSTT